MKKLILLLVALAFVSMHATSVGAASVDAREVARMNNCVPKKIDIYQQTLGARPQTTYRVECVLPKTVATDLVAQPVNAVLIQCSGSLCKMLRAVNLNDR
ncbi:MAG: hypothetical protein EOM37_03080 [Proteobacteria bacterium]|nr:hypothetical protein [Alphaproteobacteria bacterium]NCC03020.1 hypothetical protein [Pseudomonadota bacterium]